MSVGGRTAQRARTRKDILQAAARLLESGSRPSLEDIADEANVSRATAYRYFPGLDALLSEAAVHALVPEAKELFGSEAPVDAAARVRMVDDMFDQACRAREVPLRLMLARVLERSTMPEAQGDTLRQNRRVPLLLEALSPVAADLSADRRRRLVNALSMVVGTESLIALKDVVGLDAAKARDVRHWAINALVNAALKERD